MLRVNLRDYPRIDGNLDKLSSYKTEALRCNPKYTAWVEGVAVIIPDNRLYPALIRQIAVELCYTPNFTIRPTYQIG